MKTNLPQGTQSFTEGHSLYSFSVYLCALRGEKSC